MIRNLTRVFRDAGVQRGDAIHFAIDVSGTPPIRTIRGVLEGLAEACDNLQVFDLNVLQFDHSIVARNRFWNGRFDGVRTMDLIGGGGTYIEPVLKEFASVPAATSPRFFVASDGIFTLEPDYLTEIPVTYLIWESKGLSMSHLPRWLPLEAKP